MLRYPKRPLPRFERAYRSEDKLDAAAERKAAKGTETFTAHGRLKHGEQPAPPRSRLLAACHILRKIFSHTESVAGLAATIA